METRSVGQRLPKIKIKVEDTSDTITIAEAAASIKALVEDTKTVAEKEVVPEIVIKQEIDDVGSYGIPVINEHINNGFKDSEERLTELEILSTLASGDVSMNAADETVTGDVDESEDALDKMFDAASKNPEYLNRLLYSTTQATAAIKRLTRKRKAENGCYSGQGSYVEEAPSETPQMGPRRKLRDRNKNIMIAKPENPNVSVFDYSVLTAHLTQCLQEHLVGPEKDVKIVVFSNNKPVKSFSLKNNIGDISSTNGNKNTAASSDSDTQIISPQNDKQPIIAVKTFLKPPVNTKKRFSSHARISDGSVSNFGSSEEGAESDTDDKLVINMEQSGRQPSVTNGNNATTTNPPSYPPKNNKLILIPKFSHEAKPVDKQKLLGNQGVSDAVKQILSKSQVVNTETITVTEEDCNDVEDQDDDDDNDDEAVDPDAAPKFRCSICQRAYAYRRSLVRHLVVEHGIIKDPNIDKICEAVEAGQKEQRHLQTSTTTVPQDSTGADSEPKPAEVNNVSIPPERIIIDYIKSGPVASTSNTVPGLRPIKPKPVILDAGLIQQGFNIEKDEQGNIVKCSVNTDNVSFLKSMSAAKTSEKDSVSAVDPIKCFNLYSKLYQNGFFRGPETTPDKEVAAETEPTPQPYKRRIHINTVMKTETKEAAAEPDKPPTDDVNFRNLLTSGPFSEIIQSKNTSQSTKVNTLRSMIASVEESKKNGSLESKNCSGDMQPVFVCEHCGKYYRARKTLKDHFMREHAKALGEEPLYLYIAGNKYQCTVCFNFYHSASELINHTKTHTGELRCMCTICSKEYSSIHALRRHIDCVHAEVRPRPFRCQLCDYAASNKWHLKEHHRRHTGEQPFVCPICGKTFSHQGTMNRHCKTIHKFDSTSLSREQLRLQQGLTSICVPSLSLTGGDLSFSQIVDSQESDISCVEEPELTLPSLTTLTSSSQVESEPAVEEEPVNNQPTGNGQSDTQESMEVDTSMIKIEPIDDM